MIVDPKQRNAKMRAHTATHLLHFALDQILWWTKQAWSLVDDDILRFDFAAKDPLTQVQLTSIQTQVNNWIRWTYNVSVQELTLPEAKDLWAKAFFEDKYWDIVRVVSIQWKDQTPLYSVELCWWTHVSSTNMIWAFAITSQEAVASWIRRITAVTWPWVSNYAQSCNETLIEIANKLSCQPKQTNEKIDKLIKELDESRSNYEALETSLIWASLQGIISNKQDIFTYVVNISESTLAWFDFKATVHQAKQLRNDINRILYTKEGTFALFCWDWTSAKQYAQSKSLKWWWSDQLVQWRDPAISALFAN